MRIKPLKIVLLYFSLSLCWVLLGDSLVDLLQAWTSLSKDLLEILKGILFITVTGVILYLAIKRQQFTLFKSEKQYKALFYANPTPLWIYDLHTLAFLDVNEAAIKHYGYSKAAFKKMTLLDIRKVGDHEKVVSAAKMLQSGMNYSGTWQHLKSDGNAITVQITSHQIDFEGRDCVMVMAQDVTKQLEQDEKLQLLYLTERELREELEKNIELIKQSLVEKQRLTEVIDRIHNMVVITDMQGRISWVNQAFMDYTGYQLEEIEGKTTDFLHGPLTDAQLPRQIMDALEAAEFGAFEIVNYTKSGEAYWIEMTISGIYNDQHEVVRYIAIQNLITERKLNEQKLQQQNSLLKKVSWTNSHAIRKPAMSILSLVELGKEMSDLEELKAIHGLIGICSLELDEITREVSKMMADSVLKD